MSNLSIYDESRQNLSAIGFARDIKNQVKIRDINDTYEITKRSAIVFTEASNHLGIKDPIPNITKADIMELILSRFKSLSFDEIAFAFKLERYGELPPRTQAYGLFNSIYVSDVLMKYVEWRRRTLLEHEIPFSIEVSGQEPSDDEKKYWINLGVTNCLDYFMDKGHIENGKIYVHDVLVDDGYIKKGFTEKEIKSAIECIEVEQNLKKPQTRQDAKHISETLSRIQNPEDGLVVLKCKELALSDFLRNLVKDEKSVIEFREKFRPIGSY